MTGAADPFEPLHDEVLRNIATSGVGSPARASLPHSWQPLSVACGCDCRASCRLVTSSSLNVALAPKPVTFARVALAARPPASAAERGGPCAAAWGRLASLPAVDHDEYVSIELRQLTRLRTTLEVASATALQAGPAGLLIYANARNSVRAALEGSPRRRSSSSCSHGRTRASRCRPSTRSCCSAN